MAKEAARSASSRGSRPFRQDILGASERSVQSDFVKILQYSSGRDHLWGVLRLTIKMVQNSGWKLVGLAGMTEAAFSRIPPLTSTVVSSEVSTFMTQLSWVANAHERRGQRGLRAPGGSSAGARLCSPTDAPLETGRCRAPSWRTRHRRHRHRPGMVVIARADHVNG